MVGIALILLSLGSLIASLLLDAKVLPFSIFFFGASVIVSAKPADSNRRLLWQAALKRTGCTSNPLQRVLAISHRFQPVAETVTIAFFGVWGGIETGRYLESWMNMEHE